MRRSLILAMLAGAPFMARAAPKTGAPAGAEVPPLMSMPSADTRETICLLVESSARAHDLPLEFFARVIWQESRFQPGARGPVTRSGERAQGIAQFMPGTASERALLDPFDPVQALPKSAEFLSELRNRFGNLGLAAAAYNAGPRRVQDWLDGRGGIPYETRNYVSAITGASVEDWASAAKAGRDIAKPSRTQNCRELMALLRQAPNSFVSQLETRVAIGEAKPWGVQLSASFSRDRAITSYGRAMKQLATQIGDRDPIILGGVLRSRGTRTFYQVRIGVESREAANALCSEIRRAKQACLVLRNRGMQG